MAEQEQLAPHIDEITRALEDKVERQEIEEELAKYLEYNVPLAQAKRDIVRNHGGSLDTGPRNLASLTPEDSNVDLRVRVLTVNPKEITVEDEPKTIYYGFLADSSARVAYTAWQEFDALEPGSSVLVRNAYCKEAYRGDGVEINLGDYAEVGPADVDVDVGEHGLGSAAGASTGGPRTVESLTSQDRNVDLKVRVLTVNPKEIDVKGEPKTIWYGFLADETGRVPYTCWNEHEELEAGADLLVKSAYCKEGYQGEGVEVNLGDYVELEVLDEEVPVGDLDAPTGGEGDGEPQELPVQELRAGLGNVIVTARVLEAEDKTVTVDGEETTIRVGTLGDTSGKVPFTAWDEVPISQGDVLRIEDAYVKEFRGVPNLSFGERSTVTAQEDDVLPALEALAQDTPATIDELERRGGGTGVVVEGVVLEVRPGSGLVFRCPECRRVLQKRECRVHGDVEGTPDLRIKAVLDDGHGALTAIMNREVTEEVMGKTLDEYQEIARDAMTHEVVMDEVVDELTARRMRVHGNATSDDWGVNLRAREAHFVTVDDLEKEAESLLYELQGGI